MPTLLLLLICGTSALVQVHDPRPSERQKDSENVHREKVVQKDEAGAAQNWEQTAMSSGMRLHRANSALISGAFAFDTAFDHLTSMITKSAAIIANSSSADREAFNRIGTTGITIKKDTVTDGTGNLMAIEIAPGCEKHDEFGDTDCTMEWGTMLKSHGGVLLTQELNSSARMRVQLKLRITNPLLKNLMPKDEHPDLDLSCAVCGEPCVLDFGVKKYSVSAGLCPLKPGFYDFWTEDVRLPDSIIAKSIEFVEHVRLIIHHQDGQELFNGHMQIESYSQGWGGGWKAAGLEAR